LPSKHRSPYVEQVPDEHETGKHTFIPERAHLQWTAFVVLYVALVLIIDALATQRVPWPFDWSILRGTPGALQRLPLPRGLLSWISPWPLSHFDFFKFLFWFTLPFLACIPAMDWKALGFKRWKKWDGPILVGLAIAGLLAVLLIPHIPSLASAYHGLAEVSTSQKAAFLAIQAFWIFSWLLGWEFLHRYVLLRHAAAQWPRYGWLLVPLSEGLYHLPKPGIEALGMVLLSIILTRWALHRGNILLPFLVHLIIEIELVLFLLFI
jgi:membrane protease YdiL (CAAX protease family)